MADARRVRAPSGRGAAGAVREPPAAYGGSGAGESPPDLRPGPAGTVHAPASARQLQPLPRSSGVAFEHAGPAPRFGAAAPGEGPVRLAADGLPLPSGRSGGSQAAV